MYDLREVKWDNTEDTGLNIMEGKACAMFSRMAHVKSKRFRYISKMINQKLTVFDHKSIFVFDL